MIERLVEEFGQSIGVPGLQLSQKGVVSMRLGSMGQLYIEKAGDDAVVYMTAEIPYPNAKVYHAALRLCHPEERLPHASTAGLRKDNILAFIIRLSKDQLSLPELEAAIQQLRHMHERLQNIAA